TEEIYGLALFFGVLYHLKNPYYVLETLATRARYCLLSTRIARQTPRGTSMKDEPLAYLLEPCESTYDATNFRTFSETALRPPLVNLSTFRFDFRLTFPGPVILNVKINGIDLPPATYTTEGEHSYSAKLPRHALKNTSIRIDFEVDKCFPSETLDERELALLVVFWKPGLDT